MQVHRDGVTGKSKGYAQVKFYRVEFAQHAILRAHDGFLDGRRIIVTHYESARFEDAPTPRKYKLNCEPAIFHSQPAASSKGFCSAVVYNLPPGIVWRCALVPCIHSSSLQHLSLFLAAVRDSPSAGQQ